MSHVECCLKPFLRRARSINAIVILYVLVGITPLALAETVTLEIEKNMDRPGSDYRNFALEDDDLKLCQSACTNDTQCRAWTYIKAQENNQAQCLLKSAIPSVALINSCCASGIVNVLDQFQACLDVEQTDKHSRCISPGGRIKNSGVTFVSGDKVLLLAKLKRLHHGEKQLHLIYSQWQKGEFVPLEDGRRTISFNNNREDWYVWFPAHFPDAGRWRVDLALTENGRKGQTLGYAEYCVNCATK